MLKNKFILILFFIVCPALFANTDESISSEILEEITEDEALIKNQQLEITQINISGLKKTKESYIKSKLKNFEGKTIAETNLHEIETILQAEGLFESIKVEFMQKSENEASIEITVTEKITFIPLPFAMYSNGSGMAGLMIMDTNAFGIRDMFIVGGFYSSSSLTGIASYIKQPKANGIPGFSIFISSSKNTPELNNLDDETMLRFNSKDFAVGLSVLEKVGENHTFSLGGSFESFSAEEEEGYEGLVDSAKSGKFKLGWNFGTRDWNGVFLSVKTLSLDAGFAVTNLEDEYKFNEEISYKLLIQEPMFQKLRFVFQCAGFYGKDKHISDFAGKKEGAVTILPNDFLTDRIFGGNTGFEFSFFKGKFGMLSVYGCYEAVLTEDFGDDDLTFLHGVNSGLKMYFSKIDFPAMSLGLSYNLTKKDLQFAAALGISY